MLNELYQLAAALRSDGGQADPVHVDFTEPGLSSNQNLRVVLGPSGGVESVGPLMNPDFLWTLKKGNFKYFPAARISAPLITLTPEDPLCAELKKPTAAILLRLLEEKKDEFNTFAFKGELEQARRMLQWEHPDGQRLQYLKDFARTFDALVTNPGAFSRSLANKLVRTLQGNLDDKGLKACQAILCGIVKESKNKSPQIEVKVQMIFDWRAEDELVPDLYSPDMKRVVLECLNSEVVPAKKKSKQEEEQQAFECALERSPMQLLSGPYPDWSARPVLAKAFKPFSKFSDAACNSRYGRADSEGFPIGEETAKALVAAGSMITSAEQMGKTWRSLRNGRFEDRGGKKLEASDLLIAAPNYRSDGFEAVSIFAPPAEEDTEEEEDDDFLAAPAKRPLGRAFRQVAEAYIRSLEKNVDEEDLKSEIVTLLLLRQISPGQVQLVYSATPSRERLIRCVQEWLRAGSNLPPTLRVPLPSKKAESGTGDFRPVPLYPEQAIRTFSHQWMRSGLESTRVQSPPVGRIFDVFLMKEGVFQDTALELLEELLPRIEPLLVRAGNELHRIDPGDPKQRAGFLVEAPSTSPDPRYQLAHSLSLIGTLLHYLNPKSKDLMTGTAFTLGKLLAVMDHLHKCYCQVVRDGDIPPTLIGNGLLGRAADSPNDALAELQERSRIYIGWARTVDAGKYQPAPSSKQEATLAAKQKAAREAVGLLEICHPLCEALKDNEALANPMNAADKAQLLLGYLSSVSVPTPDSRSAA